MSMVVHVTGAGRERLPALDGHLIRNLDHDRFTPEALDATVDTMVASASSPADAADLLATVREAGCSLPVVLLSDGTPGWESVVSAFADVFVLADLPALEAHLGREREQPSESSGAESDRVIDLRRHVPRGGGKGLLRERLGEGTESIGRTMRDFDQTLLRVQSEAPAMSPPTLEHEGPDSGTVDSSPETNAPATSGAPQESVTRRSRRGQASPDSLVAGLLEVGDRLYGVRETGTAIAGHTKESVGADAVAVLVPDGPLWVVVGAVGHRPLEERLTVAEDHWLVQEVSHAHHGVVVEDTDIARNRLAGAPLAAWPHLLACPLAAVRGIVVLARSDVGPAFTSRDLGRASSALTDADALFRSALQLRELARQLITFAELDS